MHHHHDIHHINKHAAHPSPDVFQSQAASWADVESAREMVVAGQAPVASPHAAPSDPSPRETSSVHLFFSPPDSILALGHHHALLAPCASSATEVPDLDNGWSAPLVHIGASPLVRIPSSSEIWTVSLSTLPRQTHLPPAPAQGAHAVKLLSGHSNIHAQLFAEHGIFAPF